MKIVLVNDYQWGTGAAVACCRLGEALAAEGYEVYYLYLYKSQNCKHIGLKPVCLERNRSGLAKFKSRILFRLHERLDKKRGGGVTLRHRYYHANEELLEELLEEIQPDIVHFHNIPFMMSHDGVASVSRRFPTLWTMHDCHAMHAFAYKYRTLDGKTRIDPRISLFLSGDFNRQGEAFHQYICPSEWIANFDSENAFFPGKAHIIPYLIEGEEFFAIDKTEARKTLKLNSGSKLVVLAIASDLRNVRKNFGLVLDAIEVLGTEKFEFIAVGNVSEEIRAERKNIQFVGPVHQSEKLRQYYSAADVLVVPSLVDNLPNTVIESLSCGTTVIGASTGGIPEMVIEDKTGWTFDPYSVEALVKALEKAEQNRDVVAKMGIEGAKFAAEQYSPKRQVEAHLALYSEMIEKHRARQAS